MSEAGSSSGSFARAFTSLSLASVVSMAANLVRGKLAALFLGPAGVGVFNQLSLMWNLFQASGSLGAFNGLVQHGAEAMVAEDERALHRLASTWWILLTAVSCILAAAGALLSPAISHWLLGDRGAHATLVALMLVSIPFAVSAQIYRALLSAARLIPHLVRAQVISDVGGAIIFAALVPNIGIAGAVIGFATIHLLFYLITASSVRQTLGGSYVRPRMADFQWPLVRGNLAFGASGIAMIAISNLSILIVSRLVIDELGVGASGIFSNAWRIASVYLGAVTATSISYFLPTLARAQGDEQMSRETNAALRFYLYVLPLIMAAVMAAGEPIVWAILSTKFLAAAPLLLLFVPAELMRIVAETIAMPLLARRRLRSFTILFALQAAVFVVGAAVALPRLGLLGAAAAYATGTVLWAISAFLVCRLNLGLRLEAGTALCLLRALTLLAIASAAGFMVPFGVLRLVIVAAVCLAWLIWSLQDQGANEILSRLRPARPAPSQ